jgi:hypothetical protein
MSRPDSVRLACLVLPSDHAYFFAFARYILKETMVASPDVTALQRSDLNQFLFADVGTEASGMTLSVVSVLARQGSDPWREAGRLAGLSKAEATDSLARTIAGMPRSLWNLPEAIVIAARLTGLLPSRPDNGLQRVTKGWPIPRIATVLGAIALLVAFAASVLMR